MSKMIMLRGLPASGKSTVAKELQARGDWVRINRDLIREMLHFGKYSGRNEEHVVRVEKMIAEQAILLGKNVIIDDCNLNPKNQDMWMDVAMRCNAKFEVRHMTHKVTREYIMELMKRDSNREKTVGDHVIFQMAFQYYPKAFADLEFVICDIDGTVADLSHRLKYVKDVENKDWKSFFKDMHLDKVKEDTVSLLQEQLGNGVVSIFVTARPEDYREVTEEWLYNLVADRNMGGVGLYNGTTNQPIVIMRRSGDKRPDTDVKRDIYNKFFKNKKVKCVIDDRPSVIRMWQEEGLLVHDVGAGVEF